MDEPEDDKVKNNVAIEKLNHPRYGAQARIENNFKRGYIGDEDVKNMQNFQQQ